MQISSTVNAVRDKDDAYFTPTFKITTDSLTASVCLYEPYLHTRTSWIRLIEAIESGERRYMDFYQGNGYGRIHTEASAVSFEACPSGSGGDFSVHATVPAEYSNAVVRAMRQAIDHPDIQEIAYWRA